MDNAHEEAQRALKQATLEAGDLRLRVQVLEAQLEEKAHVESLFAQVREELARNRTAMKRERESAREELLEKEDELRKVKVLVKERTDKCVEWEERVKEVECEGNRVKLRLAEEVEQGRKRQTREALLVKENGEQHGRLEECQAEVS